MNPYPGAKGGLQTGQPSEPSKAPSIGNGQQAPSIGNASMPGGGANQATITGNPNTWNPAQTPGGNNYVPDPTIGAILDSRIGNPQVNNDLWNLGVTRDYSNPTPNVDRSPGITIPSASPYPVNQPNITIPTAQPLPVSGVPPAQVSASPYTNVTDKSGGSYVPQSSPGEPAGGSGTGYTPSMPTVYTPDYMAPSMSSSGGLQPSKNPYYGGTAGGGYTQNPVVQAMMRKRRVY